MTLGRHTCRACVVLVSSWFAMFAHADTPAAELPAANVSNGTGRQIFKTQCIVCHGIDARGIEGVGVSLVESAFVASSTVAALVEFLKVGRMPADPDNVTGLVMPGFTWMSDADLLLLSQYLKDVAE